MIDEELQLTELIDVEKLQQIQDGFSGMTGMAAGVSDANGNPVTIPAKSCDFCALLTKGTEEGARRCRECDREGGEMALQNGRASVYVCHAGLVDCAAPIIVDGKLIGSFNSGQVRVGALDEQKVLDTARELGIDEMKYLEEAKKTTEMDAGKLYQMMDFVYVVTNSLSDMAYKQYQLKKASEEVAKAAKMKADFLANMSHEIRTPMNGVIGMAELALREELPPAARDYINQIKASGKTLLAIINDILDFSKIESGKMDIVEDEYEPMSLVHDEANIVMTRIGDKPVELILDIPPDIPYKLYGDSIRIKQALINFANNAVKFTEKGRVRIRISYDWIDEQTIDMKVAVEDTGIGIKEEDLEKIFMSFQQVDSKRNRQIEGTGLGLAITKQLVYLMNGDIEVASEYGKGSTFSFHIPQKVIDGKGSISMNQGNPPMVAALVQNPYIKEQLALDIERLGGVFREISDMDELDEVGIVSLDFVFVENELFTSGMQEFARNNPQIQFVVMIDFRKKAEYPEKNILVVKKPLYVLNLANILKHEAENIHIDFDTDFNFIAPDAHILVVDDNAINLTVTEGLLEPLKMQIDTAMSGKEAIDKISTVKYDLVFMDHMMPELDGVETTHIIRRFHPEYDDVPIIALTANVIEGTKEMFIQEGMNDFVPKPIEIRSIVSKLHNWLPMEKQIRADLKSLGEETEQVQIEIEDLDTEYAMSILGSEKLYWSVLKDYYQVITKKIEVIEESVSEGDWGRYTIEVHALKSASKQIGAIELSDMAAELEIAGNGRDISLIVQKTPDMLEWYRHYEDILAPFFMEEEGERDLLQVDEERVQEILVQLSEALENLDMDTLESLEEELKGYAFEGDEKERFEKLCTAIEEYDMEACEELVTAWKK